MTVSRDPDRIIRAFIDEGLTELPDRVYDAVRSDIDRTRQRVVIGPWRTPSMNSFAKVLIAAAAVVVVAVVGINLLPRTGGDVGVAVSPSPTTSPSTTTTAAPTPSPSLAPTFPPEGDLPIGRQSFVREGLPMSFNLQSAGWMSDGNGIGVSKGELGPGWSGVQFWLSAFDNIYADPCTHAPASPQPADTAAARAAAVARIPGFRVVDGPSSVTVGGYPAQLVVLAVPDELPCDHQNFYLYYDDESGGPSGGYRYASVLGETLRVWIVDVDGTLIWIDGELGPATTPAAKTELLQIIDSIQFE